MCWDIDEGINENGGRTLDGETPIRFEYVRLRVLLRCRPSSSSPRCRCSRLFEEHTRVVKLNYETKLSAYIGYVCAYVGRSCAKGGVSPSFGLRIIFRFGRGRGERLEGEKLDETGIGNPLLSRDLTRRSREEVIFRGRVFYHRATFFFFLADKNDQYDQVDKYWICARVNETNVINI